MTQTVTSCVCCLFSKLMPLVQPRTITPGVDALDGVSVDALNGAWDLWTESVNQSIASLEFYKGHQSIAPGNDAGVSLIVHPTTRDLAFLQWTTPGSAGRVADVDHHNYLKCIVPVGAKRVPLDVSTAQILIPATGVKVLREKRRAREMIRPDANRLPDPLVRFMKMRRCADSHRTDEGRLAAVADSPCFVCDEIKRGDSEESTLRVCALCLQCAHLHCLNQLAQHANTVSKEFPRSLGHDTELHPFPESLWPTDRQDWGSYGTGCVRFTYTVYVYPCCHTAIKCYFSNIT